MIFSYPHVCMLIYKAYLRFPRCPNTIHTKVQCAVLPKNLQVEITYLTSLSIKLLLVFSHVCILILTPRYSGRFMPQYAMQLVYTQTMYIWQCYLPCVSLILLTLKVKIALTALHALLYDVIYNVIEG